MPALRPQPILEAQPLPDARPPPSKPASLLRLWQEQWHHTVARAMAPQCGKSNGTTVDYALDATAPHSCRAKQVARPTFF